MNIEVLYFSLLRDISGAEKESVVLDEAADVAGLLGTMFSRYPALADWDKSLLIAVNGEYADRDRALADGDEVALMPPVQGG